MKVYKKIVACFGIFAISSVMSFSAVAAKMSGFPPINHIGVMKINNFSSHAYHWSRNSVMDAGQVSGTQQGTFSVNGSGTVNFYNDYDAQAIVVAIYNNACSVMSSPSDVHVTVQSDAVKTCTMTISS